MSSPRHVRELVEGALDEIAWVWCRRTSLLLDELITRGEERAERDDDA